MPSLLNVFILDKAVYDFDYSWPFTSGHLLVFVVSAVLGAERQQPEDPRGIGRPQQLAEQRSAVGVGPLAVSGVALVPAVATASSNGRTSVATSVFASTSTLTSFSISAKPSGASEQAVAKLR